MSEVSEISDGRNIVSVIGIDRYHHWQRLSNAVRDATGVDGLFRERGFEQVAPPLFNDQATSSAIQALVTDRLCVLGPNDSLVIFYAGHGSTRKHHVGDDVVKTGYLIPVDAAASSDKVSTWIELEAWLRMVSLLPAKHILVILDACHSGIALDPVIKWRSIGSGTNMPMSTLRRRRSRRIITSALDDQFALDTGPLHGHSLFTGCLIEGLTGGIRPDRRKLITGSELGQYIQRRVGRYPGSQQTPDFGTFAFDNRGEMMIPVAAEPQASESASDFASLSGTILGSTLSKPHSGHTAPMVASSRGRGLLIGSAVIASVGGVIAAWEALSTFSTRSLGTSTEQPSRPAINSVLSVDASSSSRPIINDVEDYRHELAIGVIRDALVVFLDWSRTHATAPCPTDLMLSADPWGSRLALTCTEQPEHQVVGIISAGPDRALQTADDIQSWKIGRDVTKVLTGPRWGRNKIFPIQRTPVGAGSGSTSTTTANPALNSFSVTPGSTPMSPSDDKTTLKAVQSGVPISPAKPADAPPKPAPRIPLDEYGLPIMR